MIEISNMTFEKMKIFSGKCLTNNLIIAGFPGVGKSTAAKMNDRFIDMESSDYHWIYDKDGNKFVNPEWPNNYINEILCVADDPSVTDKYVLISTHNEVLKGLFFDYDIALIAVIPYTKELYINRYIERGNTKEFIEKLDKNFENFIQSVKDVGIPVIATDKYLCDLLYILDRGIFTVTTE